MDYEFSPKYRMKLVESLERAIWTAFSSYRNVEFYIEKWYFGDFQSENFHIYHNSKGDIDLVKTLHGLDGEMLLRVAIDMGVETPDFIPVIPTFRNVIKVNYQTAFDAFQKALNQVRESPDVAVGLASSALEAIIKHILKEADAGEYNEKDTLYALTEKILKRLHMFPDRSSDEIKKIGSTLLKLAQGIEDIRSSKTHFHGKVSGDPIIVDAVYAQLFINSVSTVGLFLISLHHGKLFNVEPSGSDVALVDEPEIRLEDIPF